MRWLARSSDTSFAMGQAAAVAVVTWLGAAIGIWLTARSGSQLILVSIVAVVLTAGLVFLAKLMLIARDRYVASRKEAIAYVHDQLDSITVEEQGDLLTDNTDVRVSASPLTDVKRTTRALYDFLDAKYQGSRLPGERAFLETVFMTTSYVDGLITICAWANSDRRRPTSLNNRRDQPNIYDATVTADLYRESASKRPEPRVIEDTELDDAYQQLYEHQNQRIRSTVVFPILSSESAMLGALVGTADQPGFFRKTDARFWETIFGLYGKRLALQMLRLKDAVNSGASPPF